MQSTNSFIKLCELLSLHSIYQLFAFLISMPPFHLEKTIYLNIVKTTEWVYDSGDFKSIRALIHPFELLRL